MNIDTTKIGAMWYRFEGQLPDLSTLVIEEEELMDLWVAIPTVALMWYGTIRKCTGVSSQLIYHYTDQCVSAHPVV